MLIDVDNLHKSYPKRGEGYLKALKSVSFQVQEGELVTVVGPSGCGKSTLLKILAGILSKTKGTVTLRDTPVTGPRRDIGIVFQAPTLLPWRTVLGNVMIPVEVQDRDRKKYKERAIELLDLVGLGDFRESYPFELSGGMQQRVGIGRAMVSDPAILLMDEPFGALDAMTRERMNMWLLDIWEKSGKTILFVTHSIPEACLLSDRVIVLSPRPGTVARIVDIELPRPRDLDMYSTEEFGRHTREIRDLMHAKGALD